MALFEAHVDWVKKQAAIFMPHTNRASVVDRCDLFQVGLIAMWRTCQRFDPARGIKFTTYAKPRVLGAMRDELRAPFRYWRIPPGLTVPLEVLEPTPS